MLLTPEKKFSRKFKEAILAWRMEQRLSKNEILYLYLNQIFLGHGAYGVQAAAENYFDKNVEALTLAEIDLNQLHRTRSRLPLLRDERTALVLREMERILQKG